MIIRETFDFLFQDNVSLLVPVEVTDKIDATVPNTLRVIVDRREGVQKVPQH
jgi:hypothetical protein